MLSSPINLTYKAATVALQRINQDNFSSKFFGKTADGLEHITLTVQHTIPKKAGGAGESHMARLDVQTFDATGTYVRTSSPWFVIRTNDATQNDAASLDASVALCAFLTASSNANLLAILARRS